ncbi:helix-turn-helix domain-containing protein [Halomonas halocynthiae]|uniref:helix-turn-helix domain-containing protein n=1 Tax=Halomonas halocynthiae TaxID=176290 RepID=UPI0004026065|nr:helix-turn-helix domain-containing protein [Halomonas halocynthiae]
MLAVRLRLNGHTVAEACQHSALSAPTVSAAWKAFLEGGWQAVPVKPRGRRRGSGDVLNSVHSEALCRLLMTWPSSELLPAWNSRALAVALAETENQTGMSPRAIEHWWKARGLGVKPADVRGLARKRSNAGRWFRQQVKPGFDAAVKSGGKCWQGGVRVVAATDGRDARCYQLYLHGKRGALHMLCLPTPPVANDYITLFERLVAEARAAGQPEALVALVFHGAFFQASPEIMQWLVEHPAMRLMPFPS